MRRLLWLIFALPQLLFGDWDGLFKESSDPAWVHNVNVVTGTLQLAFEDHRVEGVVPIHLVRTYSSSGATERSYRKDSDLKNIDLIWQLDNGWELFPHLQLLVDPRRSGETNLRVYAKEPSGEMIAYAPLSNESKHVAILKPEKKRGSSSGIISGRLNPNNHRLRINYKEGTAIIYLADGGKRIYKGDPRDWKDKVLDYNLLEGTRDLRHYLLQEEISPSGQRTLYQYSDDGQQIQILQCNPTGTKVYSWVSIRQANKKPPFCVSISTLFFYDDFGNVVQETLESDLGQYSKWYEYDPSTHLLMEEREENGLTHTYTYLEGTDLVLTKLSSDGAVVEFIYDNDHLLIQEKSGHFEKTYTRDPRTGMILEVALLHKSI
jgi:hypothetical protein